MQTMSRSGAHTHRAARGTLQLLLGRVGLFASGALVSILWARGLGPEVYGIYGIILSVLVWIEQVGRFGFPEAVTKLIPEDQIRAPLLERTAHTLLLCLSLALFVLSWVSAPALAALFDIPEGAFLFRLAILDLPLIGMYFAFQGILTGRRHFAVVSIGLAVYGFTKLLGTLAAWLIGFSIEWALIINILGTVGGLMFLSVHVPRRTFAPSFAYAGSLLRLALPVGCFSLALYVLFTLDLWLLKMIGTVSDIIVGNYVAALNIARIPAMVFGVVNGVVLPSIALALVHHDLPLARRYVQGATRFLWVTLLPTCVLVALTAEDLMVLLYSEPYALGAPFLVLQVCAFSLFGVAQVFSEMMLAQGLPRLSMAAALAVVPLAIMLNLLLIPLFGAMGAASALTVTALSLAAITGTLVYQRLGSLLELSTGINVVVATAAVGVVALILDGGGPWLLLVEYPFFFGLYGVFLVFLGEVTRRDLQPFLLWQRSRA